MPSTYAHNRFGKLAVPLLPEEARKTVARFRRLYDVGLHGPDLFFYYQPLFRTGMGALGGKYHNMTGREFFEAAAASVQEDPSEGAEAYLLGVLSHYMLDSACHPLIHAAAVAGEAGHTELETEFDRVLLTLDGWELPHTVDSSAGLRLTRGECVTVSRFYPPATAYTIRRSLTCMRLVNRALTMRSRRLAEAGFRLAGAGEMVMYTRPNRSCAALTKQLEERFAESLTRCPDMSGQLLACIRDRAPLGSDFAPTFG